MEIYELPPKYTIEVFRYQRKNEKYWNFEFWVFQRSKLVQVNLTCWVTSPNTTEQLKLSQNFEFHNFEISIFFIFHGFIENPLFGAVWT